QYNNTTAGPEIFKPGDLVYRYIHLSLHEPASFSYSPAPMNFVVILSIIDVLMWNAPDRVLAYLRNETRASP
ncbi:WbqC family protein, partial [Pseudomonas syringae group genomosp. 7]|uniref:WbqC family protein n=1 Tax=Pseudomonas syringae group genomosp. 7 TaxID=251699 RepID=UPI003770172C